MAMAWPAKSSESAATPYHVEKSAAVVYRQ
jgi:hypothetical protein